MTIKQEKLPMWSDQILIARHKSCQAHLAEFGKELNIQYISSKEQNKGHATELIQELLEWCKERKVELVSSMPLTQNWRNFTKKFNLKVYD